MHVEVFVEPCCWWCGQLAHWLADVMVQRSLTLHWRTYCRRLAARQPAAGNANDTNSQRAARVMEALRHGNEAATGRFYQRWCARQRSWSLCGVPAVVSLQTALAEAGLARRYALAADDASWDERIRQSMADAATVVGRGFDAPAVVVHASRTIGFTGRVVSNPPTGVEAATLWDALMANASVAGVLRIRRGEEPSGCLVPPGEWPPVVAQCPRDQRRLRQQARTVRSCRATSSRP